MTHPTAPSHTPPTGTSRRTILRTAAWAAPVVTVAAAAPAFATSPTDVGDFSLNGMCGLLGLGLLGPGFVLQAADEALPAGTAVEIAEQGVVAVNVLPSVRDASGTAVTGLATVTGLGSGNARVVLDQPLPAGAALQIRYTLSLSLVIRKSASVTLPSDYEAGPGAKTSGWIDQTAVICDSE